MRAATPEKLPPRCKAGGTIDVPPNVPEICRPDSQLKKKNVRFRPLYFGASTGPPKFPPYWLRFNRGGLAPGTRGWKPFSAVNASLRLNSHKVPCGVFVPLLVVRLTCPPGAPPFSAE